MKTISMIILCALSVIGAASLIDKHLPELPFKQYAVCVGAAVLIIMALISKLTED